MKYRVDDVRRSRRVTRGRPTPRRGVSSRGGRDVSKVNNNKAQTRAEQVRPLLGSLSGVLH